MRRDTSGADLGMLQENKVGATQVGLDEPREWGWREGMSAAVLASTDRAHAAGRLV